jgi:5'-methylthioadenosine phosphorylase
MGGWADGRTDGHNLALCVKRQDFSPAHYPPTRPSAYPPIRPSALSSTLPHFPELTLLGILGGSGLYHLDGLQRASWEHVSSPFGEPSDALLLGELDGQPLAFLPRHGRGHRIPPSAINSLANIDALKRVGVTDLVSVNAVGSLREELAPGTLVLVDQFIDRTRRRSDSFFGEGLVAHVSLAHPACGRLMDAVAQGAAAIGVEVRRGGTCLIIEGPQFSTLAESRLYQSWGCDLIGMTAMPEARLAREAELCYAALALVTDYDCWHPEHGAVSVDAVLAVMHANVARARAVVAALPARLEARPAPCPSGCDRALDTAIVTPPEARDPTLLARLDAVAGRALNLAGRS